MISRKIAAASAALGLALGLAGAANASVLTFDGNICFGGQSCANSSLIDQSYGDTAGVDVQYNRDILNRGYTTGAAGSELSWWDTNYNNLVNVAWGDAGGTPMIFLKPTTGLAVFLNGFDLGAYPDAQNATQVTIVDGLSNVLFSSGPILAGTGPFTARHFSVNLSSTSGIGIQWGPDGFNVGIDNVDFTTAAVTGVPEPGTWALMPAGFGLAGLGLRARRRALAAA